MTLTQEEFIDRFAARMLKIGTTFSDGTSVDEYARKVAPIYWAEKDQREDGPEACAEADMDCWEGSDG